jgi:hypothetical protein
MHDDARRQDDAKKKRTNNSNIGKKIPGRYNPPPLLTRDREGPQALPGTLPERGIATGGLLDRHACLQRDE